ncbi:DUF4176 domain-containing protein [Oscillospiraceae bacterium 50-58]
MSKEFLPIGSVVQLTDSTGLVMIAGYLPISKRRPGYIWDYSGFRFPIGYTDDEDIYCFDNNQVEVVYAYGYMDIEEEHFTGRLTAAKEQVAEMARQKKEGKAHREEE